METSSLRIDCQRGFLVALLVSFLIMLVLAFTPLSFIPMLFGVMTEGWGLTVLVLLLFGAPLGGFGLIAFSAIWTGWEAAAKAGCQLAGAWFGALIMGRLVLEFGT
jgi:hypothetical protein